jgi:GTP-binding protein
VSATPGKTSLLNFYRLPAMYLVDLPGYGFARASKATRAGYRKLVEGYLRTREPLAGVVWLLDVRHPPSAEDRAMQALLVEAERPVLAVLTKADKLSRSQQAQRAREMSAALGLPLDQVHLTSSSSGQGIVELAESVLAAAGGSPS